MDHKNANNHEEKNVRKKFEVLCQVCQNSLPTVREPTRRPWPIYKSHDIFYSLIVKCK